MERTPSIGSFSSLSANSVSESEESEEREAPSWSKPHGRNARLPRLSGVQHLTAYLAHLAFSQNLNRRNVDRFCELTADTAVSRLYDLKNRKAASNVPAENLSKPRPADPLVAAYFRKHDAAWGRPKKEPVHVSVSDLFEPASEYVCLDPPENPSLQFNGEEPVADLEVSLEEVPSNEDRCEREQFDPDLIVTLLGNVNGMSDPVFLRAAVACFIPRADLDEMFDGGRIFYVSATRTIVQNVATGEFLRVLPPTEEELTHGVRRFDEAPGTLPVFYEDVPDFASRLVQRWWRTCDPNDKYGGQRPVFRIPVPHTQSVSSRDLLATRFGSIKEKGDQFKATEQYHGFGHFAFTSPSNRAIAELFVGNNFCRKMANYFEHGDRSMFDDGEEETDDEFVDDESISSSDFNN